jgi:REP element-mobilizing transposase RayT
MSQKHYSQNGVFHVTTNTKNKVPWLTENDIPQMLIDNLVMTRNQHQAKVFAFCILPDHMHILLEPGEKGLSAFMHSFKRNSAINANILCSAGSHSRAYKGSHSRSYRRPCSCTSHACNDAGVCEPRLREHVIENVYWQPGYHDERIRDSRQRKNAIGYIQYNATRHGLVKNIDDWPWTSLHFSHLLDPMEVWLE